jgi:hypothetical protein
MSPPGRGSRKKDLEIRIGKYHGADIPPVYHHIHPRAHHGAEVCVHPLSDHRYRRYGRDPRRHRGRTNGVVHRLATEIGAEPMPVREQLESAILRRSEDRLGVYDGEEIGAAGRPHTGFL